MTYQPFRTRGFVAIPRGVIDHPIFKQEPFTEVQAFFWLWDKAVYSEAQVRSSQGVLHLSRGQCAYATRYLAEAWQWKKDRVSRYLQRLESAQLITLKRAPYATRKAGKYTRAITVITICDYNIMQESLVPSSVRYQQQNATATRQKPDSNATNNKKGNKNKKRSQYYPYHQFRMDRERIYNQAFEKVFGKGCRKEIELGENITT